MMSTEVMTAQEAFDEYVGRKVTERNMQTGRIAAWDDRWVGCPTSEHIQTPKRPAEITLERDVEIRAIQIGID